MQSPSGISRLIALRAVFVTSVRNLVTVTGKCIAISVVPKCEMNLLNSACIAAQRLNLALGYVSKHD
jgi:hypothetical protein